MEFTHTYALLFLCVSAQLKAQREKEEKIRRHEMSQMRAEGYKQVQLQRELEEKSRREELENARAQSAMHAHVRTAPIHSIVLVVTQFTVDCFTSADERGEGKNSS